MDKLLLTIHASYYSSMIVPIIESTYKSAFKPTLNTSLIKLVQNTMRELSTWLKFKLVYLLKSYSIFRLIERRIVVALYYYWNV